jgi:hypothetical protein
MLISEENILGIRNQSAIRLVSRGRNTSAPLSAVPLPSKSTPEEMLRDVLRLPGKPKMFTPSFGPKGPDWACGGIFYPVDRNEFPDTFTRLEDLSANYSGKTITRKLGKFTLEIHSDDDYDPPVFRIRAPRTETPLAEFYIGNGEDDDILSISVDWDDKVRQSSAKEHRDFLTRNNLLIAWVLNRL